MPSDAEGWNGISSVYLTRGAVSRFFSQIISFIIERKSEFIFRSHAGISIPLYSIIYSRIFLIFISCTIAFSMGPHRKINSPFTGCAWVGWKSIYVQKGSNLDTQETRINKENGTLNIFLWKIEAPRCWFLFAVEGKKAEQMYLVFKTKLQIINSLLLSGKKRLRVGVIVDNVMFPSMFMQFRMVFWVISRFIAMDFFFENQEKHEFSTFLDVTNWFLLIN